MQSQTGQRIRSVSGAFTSYRWMLVVCLSILLAPIRARWWNEDSLAQHSIRNGNRVQIMQLYEGRNILRLRCDAQGINASDSLVLLACPSVKTGFCRQNCISPCLIVEGSPECSNRTLTPIQYCHYRVVSADHVRVDYKVHLESDQDSGKWWCMFRGQSSDPVILQYQPPQSVIMIPDIKAELMSTNKPTNGTATTESIDTNSMNPNADNSDSSLDLTEGTQFVFVTNMPLEIMIAIVIFVCLSVIFNVAFFIRCCMVNNYLKKLHKGEPRNQCFDHWLCMRNSKLLPNRSRLNYIRIPEHKSSSQLVYPSSPIMSASLRPGSTLFLPTNNVAGPIYPTSMNSPVLVRNITTSTAQYETQPGMELIYDDVNHSTTYTTVNNGNKSPVTNPLMPVVSTPDGRTWVLDRTGRVYLPCTQPAFPINYETSAKQLGPLALPYESNSYALNCIPEYEQDDVFRGPVLLSNKRSATPLPSRPVQNTVISRADSTPPLVIPAGPPGSARDLSRSPRPANQY